METEKSSDLRAGGRGPSTSRSMRATKLPLRPTLVVVLLARGHRLLIPNPPQPRDQRACGMPLLSASIFRSIKIRDPRGPQVWEGLRVKKIVMRLKVLGHLNPNHCSRLGSTASRPSGRDSEGGHFGPLPQSSGWKKGEQGRRVSIILSFIFGI